MPSTGPRVAPSLGRALLITLVYVVIAPGGELLFGENADHIKASEGNALVGLVLPMGVGILATLVIGGFWGWREVFRERPELRIHHPRSLRLGLSLFALFVIAGLAPDALSTPRPSDKALLAGEVSINIDRSAPQ